MATLYYPELLKNAEAFPAHIMFTFYERGSTQESSQQDDIHLYMPENFGQPNTVTWDSFKTTQAVAGTLSAAGSATGVTGAIGTALGARGAKFLRGMQQVGGAAKDLAALTTGVTINPYLAQMFRGVDFRNFRYTFRFVPFAPKDCDTILEIIKTFRKWSLPEGPQYTGDPLLYYPGEVEINYIFAGDDNKWIHKFKRCVITGIDINYTGAGMWTMMRNGFPTETVMNVNLSEIEVVVRKDVIDSNY